MDFSFSFFFFFFLPLLFTSSLCIFWSFCYSFFFFFFPPLPKVHLIPISRWSFSFSCLLNVPESLFFFSLALILVASTCWRRARGEERIDRSEGRFIRYCVARTNDNCNSLLESIALVFCPDGDSLDRCVKLPVLILIVRFFFFSR